MQIIRNTLWVLALLALAVFTALNWTPVKVTIWGDLVLDTKLPALVIVSFLAGLLPMWLTAKAGGWRMKRRIGHLENALSAAQPTATMTATQLDAAAHNPGPDNAS